MTLWRHPTQSLPEIDTHSAEIIKNDPIKYYEFLRSVLIDVQERKTSGYAAHDYARHHLGLIDGFIKDEIKISRNRKQKRAKFVVFDTAFMIVCVVIAGITSTFFDFTDVENAFGILFLIFPVAPLIFAAVGNWFFNLVYHR